MAWGIDVERWDQLAVESRAVMVATYLTRNAMESWDAQVQAYKLRSGGNDG